MFCAYCGKELPPNVVFCPYCGNKSVLPKEDNNTQIVEPTYQRQDTANSYNENTADVTTNPAVTGSAYYDNKGSDAYSVSAKDDPTYAKPFSKTGLFNYRGRRSRSDYFKVGFATAVVQNALKKVPVINVIVIITLIYVNFTNASKRLHDIDKPTSWAIALGILDFISGFIVGLRDVPFETAMLTLAIPFIPRLILLCIKGTEGPNQYGPDPLAMDEE